MIAINTNGKMEYSYFCPTEYAAKVEEWRKGFEGFILQHQETVIAEIYPKKSRANLFFSTIPSERYDFGNRICDTSFAAIDVNYNGDGKEDFEFFKSVLLMYDSKNEYRILGNYFDSVFTEDFYNEINIESVHYKTTFELVETRLKKVHTILDNEIKREVGIAPEVKENHCRILPTESNRSNFVTALETATKATKTDKIILMITSMSVNEEKIKKLFNTQDETIVKALVYSANVKTEEQPIEIKKKRMSIPTKVGIATVVIGIMAAILMTYLESSKTLEKPSDKSAATSSEKSSAQSQEKNKDVIFSPGTYTDGNLTLRVSDSLLQMFDANDSLIQGFIFRLDSLKRVDK